MGPLCALSSVNHIAKLHQAFLWVRHFWRYDETISNAPIAIRMIARCWAINLEFASDFEVLHRQWLEREESNQPDCTSLQLSLVALLTSLDQSQPDCDGRSWVNRTARLVSTIASAPKSQNLFCRLNRSRDAMSSESGSDCTTCTYSDSTYATTIKRLMRESRCVQSCWWKVTHEHIENASSLERWHRSLIIDSVQPIELMPVLMRASMLSLKVISSGRQLSSPYYSALDAGLDYSAELIVRGARSTVLIDKS